MQSIRQRYSPLPSPPPDKSLFSSDLSRFALKLGSYRSQEPPVVASFPSPPMSGSPPPPTPPENLRASGLSRKRSLTPSGGTAQSYQPHSTLQHDSYATPGRPGEFRPLTATTFSPSLPGLSVAYPQSVGYPQPVPYQQSYGTGYLGAGPASGGSGLYPAGPTLPSQHEAPVARTARKPKAHVASACVNCKKKHLRCDNARPCRRCTQSGKEDTCVDVTHKKRGRPPLKADENSPRRPYETSLGSLTTATVRQPTRATPSSQPYYGQAGGLPAPRGLAPLPTPRPGDERRRPPPLFQFQAHPPAASGPQLQPTYEATAAHPGHRHFSSDSSAASNRPHSPFFTSPLHSPLGPGQPRNDPYGRPYLTPAPTYPSMSPSSAGQQRSYGSISSIASSNAQLAPHQQPQPTMSYQQLPPPQSAFQLPPLQQSHHQQQHSQHPSPPSLRVEQPSMSSGPQYTARPESLAPQTSQSDDANGREAKRQRMDLGGMLRRPTEQ